MTGDDSKHGRGEPELCGDVEVRSRADESLDSLEMTPQGSKDEGRLTEPIKGIDVGAARDLGAKGRRITLPGGLFPLARHLVSFAMPLNAGAQPRSAAVDRCGSEGRQRSSVELQRPC